MKLAMTALMPASAFADEHERMKIAKQLLASMARQLRADGHKIGDFRLSILVETLANTNEDKVGQAVREGLNG